VITYNCSGYQEPEYSRGRRYQARVDGMLGREEGGVGQLGEGEQMGSVYKQPEREEDNSCHIWREPSKWRGCKGN
jgi:hypothetical protein